MKIVLLTLLSCILFNIVTAQDSIFLRNKKVIAGKVSEIGESVISYKKAENPAGPDYKISVGNVKRIVFENGSVEEFKRPAPRPPHPRIKSVEPADLSEAAPSKRVETIIKNKALYPRSLPDNLLSAGYYMAQTVYNDQPDEQLSHGLYAKYERLILNEVVGIGVTPFVAFNQKHIGAKFNIAVYTKFFGKFRIGIGPYYSIAQQKYRRSYWTRTSMQGFPFSAEVHLRDGKATVGTVGFSSTALFHVSKEYMLTFGADVGGGVHINKYKGQPADWSESGPGNGATFGWLNIGVVRRF